MAVGLFDYVELALSNRYVDLVDEGFDLKLIRTVRGMGYVLDGTPG